MTAYDTAPKANESGPPTASTLQHLSKVKNVRAGVQPLTFSSRSAYLSTGFSEPPALPPDAPDVAVPRRPRCVGLAPSPPPPPSAAGASLVWVPPLPPLAGGSAADDCVGFLWNAGGKLGLTTTHRQRPGPATGQDGLRLDAQGTRDSSRVQGEGVRAGMTATRVRVMQHDTHLSVATSQVGGAAGPTGGLLMSRACSAADA